MAAKRIGCKTVTYVGNIYKYYVTYQLAVAESEAMKRSAPSKVAP